MLKALELVGFKSFADKTRFDFPRGITAVVGPNGSGKSNVVDAIKWVLGEQSVKSLRGKEMADVIFNGSASRPPLNYAETTLTLDNSSRRLPIDTPEVFVTRRVYRNGESEYQLNRQPCRLRDIRELFSGTGVATEAYSVIEQGKVDVLLQSSPRDRRLIFEEAAGISRFKAKKLESLRRLERVDQNLLRLSDIVAEVEHRLRQVRLQAAKARRYKDYTTRLQQLRTHVGLSDWRELGERQATLAAACAAVSRERDATVADAGRADAEALAQEARIAATSDAIRASESQAALRREGIATREATIEHQRQRSSELEKEISRLRRQLAAVSVRVGGLEQQLQETAGRLSTAEEEHARIAATAAESEQRLATHVQGVERLRRLLEQARQAHLAEVRRNAQWESESSALAAQLRLAEDRRQEQQLRQGVLAEASAKVTAEIEELTSQHTQLAAQKDAQSLIESKAREQAQKLSAELANLHDQVEQARQRHAAAHERAMMLNELEQRREGISEAVKQVLAKARDGSSAVLSQIRGVVADLLQVSVEMAPLVEAALGDRAQHLVVISVDEVVDAWQPFTTPGEGQVTFTPVELREVRGSAPPMPFLDLRGSPGVSSRADDCVQTAPQFVPLARRLLGTTWIVETLARARELAHEHPQMTFVTHAGELVSPDGTVSFGSCQPASGLISRRSELREIEQQVTALEATIDDRITTIAERTREANEVSRELEGAQADRQRLAAELAEVRLRGATARERLARIEQQQTDCQHELSRADEALQGATRGLSVVAEHLKTAAATLAELEHDAAQTTSQTAMLEAQRAAAESAAQAERVELAKSDERLANLRLRARQLEQDSRERRRTVNDVGNELSQCRERHAQAQRSILEAESEAAELYLLKQAAMAETDQLVDRHDLERTTRAEVIAQAQRLRSAARELDERLHTEELALHEVRLARDSLAGRLREDYGIEIAELGEVLDEEESRRREQIDEEIAELRRKIQHIGNVNLDALGELEELEVRFASLSSQHRDLSAGKQSLIEIIDRINADSRRLFAETLEKVRENFQVLFRKMFGGGQADIVLDEGSDLLESGIEIVARPPGKEPRNISLLSGGEKTLTCVALLLAIFQYRPSPFCVLDEVDAALDEANIERFAGVLQEFLAWTQFIVVTHSKKTMTCATTLYGVTMQESGVSKRVSVRFEDISTEADIPPDLADGQRDGSFDSDETQAA